MKILMTSSEVTPYAKTGGLADVVPALAKGLEKLGHDVRIIMPRYYKIDRTKLEKMPEPVSVYLGYSETKIDIFADTLPDSAVKVYFIDHEESFGRDGIYGVPGETDFNDNPQRFSLMAHVVFQFCRTYRWIPDIIHAHDWPTALIPILLKFNERHDEFAHTASVFTIHNIGYQGIYGKHLYPYTGLSWDNFYAAGFEDWDRMNFLKAGITSSDKLTTVSPTYAKEIQQPEYGFRMDGILRYRSADLSGILNGVDTKIWNPATDPLIPSNYTAESIEKKQKNKAELQKAMDLPVDPDIPIVGLISRLVDQKGISELFGPTYGSVYRICTEMKLQMAVLGAGELWCENEIRSLTGSLPNFRSYIGYNENLSHLIEAGSDFFLMPSRYEPSGLNQMYSLLYGTLPIVRNTGGLADTVENYNEMNGSGTGFVLDNLTPQSIFDTVGWAVYTWFNRKEHILEMQKRGMKKQFGWDISAKQYEDVYKNALAQFK
ncbi:glycogen synthase [Brucepastera parasyntrophica]|uniref:glycogen synthase n=1 Tax=Brucepastera parasyntrophica TaxID=2880008 RepID=UPI002108B8F2|nr:glycogen/starch synthase [Brucepastera parasyntrophica]ULQ60035.1 glycogen synthase [Brucepastera parasyntrophica]